MGEKRSCWEEEKEEDIYIFFKEKGGKKRRSFLGQQQQNQRGARKLFELGVSLSRAQQGRANGFRDGRNHRTKPIEPREGKKGDFFSVYKTAPRKGRIVLLLNRLCFFFSDTTTASYT